MPKVVGRLAGLLLTLCGLRGLGAETLEDALRAAGVPTGRFAASELSRTITSYAISKEEPFLLALQPLFGVTTIAELVSGKPDAAFGPASRRRPN